MQKEHLDQLDYMLSMYGAYEVTKALKELAVKASDEYTASGNTVAIIHSDAMLLTKLVYDMKASHPLRIMRDGS